MHARTHTNVDDIAQAPTPSPPSNKKAPLQQSQPAAPAEGTANGFAANGIAATAGADAPATGKEEARAERARCAAAARLRTAMLESLEAPPDSISSEASVVQWLWAYACAAATYALIARGFWAAAPAAAAALGFSAGQVSDGGGQHAKAHAVHAVMTTKAVQLVVLYAGTAAVVQRLTSRCCCVLRWCVAQALGVWLVYTVVVTILVYVGNCGLLARHTGRSSKAHAD
jgi:hypothetical protein